MSPEEFLIAINISPERWTERELQSYIIKVLTGQGYQVKEEVTLRRGRADIVCVKHNKCWLFEVKKYLDRNHINEAFGQSICYLDVLKKEYKGLREFGVILIGLSPKRAEDYQSAINTAAYVQETKEYYEVIFINEDERWYPVDNNEKVVDKKPFSYIINLLIDRLIKSTNYRFNQPIGEHLTVLAIATIIVSLLLFFSGSNNNSLPKEETSIQKEYLQ
jgi:hypothetical protein